MASQHTSVAFSSASHVHASHGISTAAVHVHEKFIADVGTVLCVPRRHVHLPTVVVVPSANVNLLHAIVFGVAPALGTLVVFCQQPSQFSACPHVVCSLERALGALCMLTLHVPHPSTGATCSPVRQEDSIGRDPLSESLCLRSFVFLQNFVHDDK